MLNLFCEAFCLLRFGSGLVGEVIQSVNKYVIIYVYKIFLHIYIYLIQLEYRGNIHLDRPGGMRKAINPPAHLWWCIGRVGWLSFKLNFPFFMPSCHHWVRAIRRAEHPRPSWGPLLLYLPAENIQHRPLLMYPLTDFSTRPTGGPLSLYLLAEKTLVAVPSGRKKCAIGA